MMKQMLHLKQIANEIVARCYSIQNIFEEFMYYFMYIVPDCFAKY